MPGAGDITRRAAIGAIAAGGLGYAAFGPRRARETPSGRVAIDYWEKWTGQEARAMQRVVDAFNQSQDRIWVRYFSMSAIDQKAMVAVAGGDPPDLVGMWNTAIPSYSETNAITPIDELNEQWGDEIGAAFERRYGDRGFAFDKSHYAGPVWKLMRYRDRTWGAVTTCSTLGLVYSKQAFRDAGLDPDRPPRTIAELDEYAERMTVKRSDGSIEKIGFVHRDPGWWNYVWGYPFGGTLYDPETGRATAASEQNVRGYEWLRSYPEKYGVSRFASFQSGFGNYNSAQQPLLAGKVAMALHGPFLVNVINTFKPEFEYASAPFPVAESVYDPQRPIGMIEGDVLFIPRGSKHPREAFEFLCYTQRADVMEQLATDHAKPSPLRVSSPGFAPNHPHKYIGVFNDLARSERAFMVPQTPAWPRYKDEYDAMIETLWRDLDRSPREILEGIESRAQAAIDQYQAERERRGRS